jgi:hypothetical protein
MSTMLQVTNRVLRRLREDEVASVADNEYSQLIGDFVADIQEEMVQRHDWTNLFVAASAALADATASYDLAGTNGQAEPWITTGGAATVTYTKAGSASPTPDGTFKLMPFLDYNACVYRSDQTKIGQPHIGGLTPNIATGLMQLQVYPTPGAAQVGDSVTILMFVPPARLEVDGSDDATLVPVPDNPLYLGALQLALNERGEEIGEPGNVAERRYENALGAAIEADLKVRQLAGSREFFRD